MSKIYFDTTPLIYFLDDEKPFSDKVAAFIADHQNEDDIFVTSTITDSEYLVFPYRNNDFQKILSYETMLADFNFRLLEPNRNITKKAAEIRAKYPAIKGMDSLHLATSIINYCDIFLTNDIRLQQVKEVNVQVVDNL